jgi:DNA repair exonuclease SbcCD ATPase subunit
MERVFCALALKLALRTINNISKPSFLFLDEVCGSKLVESSVDKFMNLLEKMKEQINRIVIVEHVHTVPMVDGIIFVEKDNKGVSSLSIDW